MRRTLLPLLAWAALLAGLWAMLWIWSGQHLPVAMLGFAVLATLLLVLALGLHQGRAGRAPDDGAPPGELRAVPERSFGAALVGIGIGGLLYGARFGFFLVLISAGVVVIGLGRLALETRSSRRARGR